MTTRVALQISPRASKNKITGPFADDSYKVYLTAAPVDGKANEALLNFLSNHFDVAKSRIRIVKGEKSKKKIVEIF